MGRVNNDRSVIYELAIPVNKMFISSVIRYCVPHTKSSKNSCMVVFPAELT